ncbi:MAG: AMP-binding protein [Simkaniaceae bacterium]
MRKVFIWLGSWLILRILALRYKIEVKGLQALDLSKGGVLFLPNHPAEIDPIIMNCLLALKFHPRPLVIAHFYYMRGARFFMDIVRALPMPNFDVSANSWKLHQVEKRLEQVKEEGQKGENFLIYPSGHLKREGHESIGGNSFIHRILQSNPNTRVVLIRTSGLWGSIFSCALTGNSPDFWKMLGWGMKIVLKNGIFFTPRRKVLVEFELAGKEFPYKGTRLELNQYLEKWYNRYVDEKGIRVLSEPLKLVSFSLFSKVFPVITKEEKERKEKKEITVPQSIREDVYQELKKLSGVKEIREEMDLSKDLGLDSLDIAGIHAFLDQRYDVEAATPGQMRTVYDLLQLIVEGSLTKPKLETSNLKDYAWPEEVFRPSVRPPQGKTIPECFLNVCDRMGKTMACADDFTKIMNYREVKLGVMVISRKLMEWPDKYIGVMLPSSVGCYIIILSLLFAGKIPVILNWTAGARSLSFARDLLGFKTVLSSRRFLERVEALELGDLEDQILLMEDFRQTVSLFDKISGLYLARKKAKTLYKHFHLERIQENDPAVVLFTSGTEAYPKAVPLSHKNLLSNECAALAAEQIEKTDILYGVLPPFHSFGFSVTGLLPLLSGLRVFYAPDPTDTHGMVRDCFFRKVTLMCCAPSFYRNLFRIATPRQLKSVRLLVSGAEKAPPELFEHAKRFGKKMIEGYGITECSPIVTINRSDQKPKGVGQPLEGIELCIIHPETGEKLPNEQQGEVCIHGPSVFTGYLGKEAPNPFIEIEGKKWYRSGDLGHIDPDGSLILGGRLKRFVKIGGEMVSLTAIEEALIRFSREQNLIKNEEEKPQLAIGVQEGERPNLILFTTFSIEKEKVNQVLLERGFPRLVKIAEVRQIPEIPMTGTGKVQLRKLQELVHDKNL